jgi:uncharacterized membrane protein
MSKLFWVIGVELAAFAIKLAGLGLAAWVVLQVWRNC